MKLSPEAKKLWEKVPVEVRMKILNNVYCTKCKDITGIGNIEGSVEKKDLILRGVCTRCSADVARLIESQ